jgi:enoyl-CoA hydratase/carnithine racemase
MREELGSGVLSLSLARPDRGNALSEDLVAWLAEQIADAYKNEDIHTLVLQGQGRHFCTGFDLSTVATSSDGDLLARFVRIEMLLASIWHAPFRTVALATGRVWGAGADLFTACDFRVANPSAKFCFPGAAFGLALGTRRLSSRIGADLTRRCVSEGLILSADQALACGLATHLTDNLDNWLSNEIPAFTLDRSTGAIIHRATRPDHREQDLAELVRSAVRPGLVGRIITYSAGRRGIGSGHPEGST